jgi:hypothetical protein
MCPTCIASAAVVVGSVLSPGGIGALAVKLFRAELPRVKKSSTPGEAVDVSNKSTTNVTEKKNGKEKH